MSDDALGTASPAPRPAPHRAGDAGDRDAGGGAVPVAGHRRLRRIGAGLRRFRDGFQAFYDEWEYGGLLDKPHPVALVHRDRPHLDAFTLRAAGCGPGDGDADPGPDRAPDRHAEAVVPGQPGGPDALLEGGIDPHTGTATATAHRPNGLVVRNGGGRGVHRLAPTGGYVIAQETPDD